MTIIPNFQIKPMEGVSKQFILQRVVDFAGAIDYVWKLPYGKNSDRSYFRLVLKEQCGTCSTKHAILSQLALDHGITSIQLTLGIYEMNENNTPGVGSVLEKHGFSYLPEAHCFLTCNGRRIDITHSPSPHKSIEPIQSFLHEEIIQPFQIGKYKTMIHQQFLEKWLPNCGKEGMSLEKVWRMREECISAISTPLV